LLPRTVKNRYLSPSLFLGPILESDTAVTALAAEERARRRCPARAAALGGDDDDAGIVHSEAHRVHQGYGRITRERQQGDRNGKVE
jgi:hypothetical protein